MAYEKGISFLVSGSGISFTISGGYDGPFISGVESDYKGLQFNFTKFFPYDNGQGQPIYNTGNGAQLRDPITGL